MGPTHRRSAALALWTTLLGGASASAQELPRFRVDLEAALSGIASTPQRDEFGLGGGGAARVRVRVLGPAGVHLLGAAYAFPSRGAGTESGTLFVGGAGVHAMPRLGPGVLLVDAEAQLFPTAGGGQGEREPGLAFGGGVGYLFRATPWLDVGPVARAVTGQMVFARTRVARDDMATWSAGVTLSLHAGAAQTVVRDSDGDGLDDRHDGCPAASEDLDGFRDVDGCPDPDNDLDGVLDAHDRCPNVQEDRDGFDDSDGCPDDDDDGDGVDDRRDACVHEPEDPDGHHDDDGCPDDDDDGDGVPDVSDRCLTQPETRNGFLDDDGCPDDAPPQATLRPGRIELTRPVTFEDGSDRLRATAHAPLDALARLLRERVEVNALRIDVTADERPTLRANITLGVSRARTVLRYLTAQGVNPLRLSPQGLRGPRQVDGGRASFAIIAGPWAPLAPPP